MEGISGRERIRAMVNTPFKKVMFGLQILSYFLIVGSPVIGGAIAKVLDLSGGRTAAVILGVFIAGEVLFYGTLAFLGKGLVLLIRDLVNAWFQKRKQRKAAAR